MNTGTISMRYARALLAYAKEQNVEDAIYGNMLQLLHTLVTIRELPVLLRAPALSKRERVKLICSAVESSPVFENFARLVVKKEREPLLPFIAHCYISIYRSCKNIKAVELTTAVTAGEELKKKITAFMSQNGTVNVELSCKEDPSIIGGFICETESKRLDASILGSLNRIRKQLIKENRKLV